MRGKNKYPEIIVIRYSNVDTYNAIGEVENKSVEIELTEDQKKHIRSKVRGVNVVFLDATIIES